MGLSFCGLDTIQCPKCGEVVFIRHLRLDDNKPETVQCDLCKVVLTIIQNGTTMRVTYPIRDEIV